MEESLRQILDSFLSHAPQSSNNGDNATAHEKETRQEPIAKKKEPLHRAIKKEWTFETFVTGATNDRACLAARKLAEWNLTEWNNPLVIVGNTGVGKSHLIHAIAHKAWELKSSSRVIYIDARDYVHEYRDTMFGDMPAKQKYEKKYAEADMILFESLHLFRGPGSQSQFAFVLDQAEKRKAIVIVTSLQPVISLESLNEELRSRLQKADFARIEKPDPDLMVHIALSKANRLGFLLPLTDAQMLADKAVFDIRALEGYLYTIRNTIELRGCDVKTAIDEWTRYREADARNDTSAFTPIAMAVSQSFGVTIETLMSGKGRAFDARSAVMLICRLRGLSDHHIAWFFGKKPEEISRAIARLQIKMAGNEQLKKQIQNIHANFSADVDDVRRF